MFQENCFKTCILSRVKQITSPGWMRETSAQAWCTGKTQRDRVEGEMGAGIGMGITCKPMADSFQCMKNPLQYCKVISLQLIKTNKQTKTKKQKNKKTFHYLLQGRTYSFKDISPMWPPLPRSKVIKLSFSTLPKSLSLRLSLAPVYREPEL